MIQDTVKKIKASIVGCGRISSSFEDILDTQKPHSHAGAYSFHQEVDLVSASDICENARESFRKRWGVPTFENYIEMINNSESEIVSICTPPDTHTDQIIKIVENCPSVRLIWCEKPISTSVQDTIFVSNLCKEKNVSLTVNTWRRWDMFHKEILKIINSGEIGRAYLFDCRAHVGIMNTCSHLFDLILMYSQSESESVFCKMDRDGSDDPGFVGTVELESGVTAFIDNVWKEEQKLGVYIQGEKGSISAFSDGVLLNEFYVRKKNGSRKVLRSDFNFDSPMLCAVSNFVNHIKKGEKLECTSEDAAEVMKIISACYQSDHLSQVVKSVQPEFINMNFKSRQTSMTKSGRIE